MAGIQSFEALDRNELVELLKERLQSFLREDPETASPSPITSSQNDHPEHQASPSSPAPSPPLPPPPLADPGRSWLASTTIGILKVLRSLFFRLTDTFRHNPYRAPPTVYVMMGWSLLMYILYNLTSEADERDRRIERIMAILPVLVQFTLFLFPPMIAMG